MAKSEIQVGDKVRLTTEFLRATGQYTSAGHDRWVVQAIDAEHGWAVVDERVQPGWFTAEELKADPSLAFRRIALGNLEVVQKAWWREAQR